MVRHECSCPALTFPSALPPCSCAPARPWGSPLVHAKLPRTCRPQVQTALGEGAEMKGTAWQVLRKGNWLRTSQVPSVYCGARAGCRKGLFSHAGHGSVGSGLHSTAASTSRQRAAIKGVDLLLLLHKASLCS